jgi:DNA-binding NarL/FixJ family response regulator
MAGSPSKYLYRQTKNLKFLDSGSRLRWIDRRLADGGLFREGKDKAGLETDGAVQVLEQAIPAPDGQREQEGATVSSYGPGLSQKPATPVRVLIADDHTLFREGLARLLEEDPRVEVVDQARDGLEAVELAANLRPDVILMDLKMPNLNGAEAARRIIAERPDIKVLVLTCFETEGVVLEAMRAGVSGYMLKDVPPEALVSSILATTAGEYVIASPVAKRLIDSFTAVETQGELFEGLSAREIQIVKLIASGLVNKQIARRLQVSEKTVRNHISNVYQKLGVMDRSQVALYAVRKGLVAL